MMKMFDLILLLSLTSMYLATPVVPVTEADAELIKFQNENARYNFGTNIDDKISDLTHHREETRDGLKVTGQYSYSDGYVQRTVHYVADDKGYRITAQSEVPLNGPNVNPLGTADIEAHSDGTQVKYRIHQIPVATARVLISDLDDIRTVTSSTIV